MYIDDDDDDDDAANQYSKWVWGIDERRCETRKWEWKCVAQPSNKCRIYKVTREFTAIKLISYVHFLCVQMIIIGSDCENRWATWKGLRSLSDHRSMRYVDLSWQSLSSNKNVPSLFKKCFFISKHKAENCEKKKGVEIF